MKYIFGFLLAGIFSATAFAGGFDIGSSRQEQGQTQRQDQSQKAYGGDSKSLAGAVSVSNVTQESAAGAYNIRSVPDAFAPNVYPTSPCMGSSSIGGSGMAFGFSVGTSWTDDECGIRETARSFVGMDMKADALAVLCSSKYAAVAPACKPK